MRPTLALLALLLAAPAAAAVDLLPTEVAFGRDEARLLVRSSTGGVHVRTEPSVLAAGVAPGDDADRLAPTPLALEAPHVWRGIDGIVELVLRRDDASQPVDIIVEDGANTGVWLEWPAERRRVPGFGVSVLLSTLGVAALRCAKPKGFPPPTRLQRTMAAVDPATLQKLRRDLGGEADVMRELIDTFLGEAPRLLGLMREGAAHGRQRDINRAVHSLKSTAATFGAARLSQLCRDLEELSARDTPADAAARVQEIENEWESVRKELADLRP